jgi:DNA polymerase III epsilon subunit-like protein
MAHLAFCDTETTGLDPDRHEVWEVGLIVDEREHHWFLPVDLGRADAIALKIGQFYDRYRLVYPSALGVFATEFADLTRGRHLVGAVISFDEERLRKLLRANGACPEWHYHLVDVEALVAGKLGIAPPWDSNKLSADMGIDPEQFDRHTALGDARWAKALYEAVLVKDSSTESDKP